MQIAFQSLAAHSVCTPESVSIDSNNIFNGNYHLLLRSLLHFSFLRLLTFYFLFYFFNIFSLLGYRSRWTVETSEMDNHCNCIPFIIDVSSIGRCNFAYGTSYRWYGWVKMFIFFIYSLRFTWKRFVDSRHFGTFQCGCHANTGSYETYIKQPQISILYRTVSVFCERIELFLLVAKCPYLNDIVIYWVKSKIIYENSLYTGAGISFSIQHSQHQLHYCNDFKL